MNAFETFILKLPFPLLKKVSYLWLLVVIFYTWPPIASGILILLIVISLILIEARWWVWEAYIRRDCRERKITPYRDKPHLRPLIQVRNVLLVILGGAVVAYLLDGKVVNLTGIQWFALIVGFFLLQREFRLFGAPTVYYVTDEGLWLGCYNLRLFFRYDEIGQVVPVEGVKKPPAIWEPLTPSTNVTGEGLLLRPADPQGFTRLINEIFISPRNRDEFMRRLPQGLIIKQS